MRKRNIKKFVDNIQDYQPTVEEISKIEKLADKYMDKDEDDLFVEIINIKDKMEEDMTEEQLNAIYDKLESIRPMLTEEQNAKLDRVIDILERERR